MSVKQAAHTRIMFDWFSIGTSKSNLVLGKKADFTPQNFFRELKGQTFAQPFQRTIVKSEMEKKKKISDAQNFALFCLMQLSQNKA